MTASRHPTEQFLVFDPEDRLHSSLCFGEAETREVIDQFGSIAGLRVWRVTPDEMSRDVTDQFIGDEDDADDVSGIPSSDSLRRWHERRVL